VVARIHGVALVALLALGACRRGAEAPMPVALPPASDAAVPVDALHDAAVDAGYAQLGQLDPAFLDGVTVETGKVLDATGLGATLDVRLVQRITRANPGLPVIEVLLVVSGSRTVAVDLGHTFDLEYDENTPTGTLVVVGVEDEPEPWSTQDEGRYARPLPSRAPVLYELTTDSPHLVDTFVVVREKRALVAFSYFIDDGEAADDWTEVATVELPRGAILRFP
jgi:hypothetical protein